MLQDTPKSLGKRLRDLRKKYKLESPGELSELFKKKYSVSGILKRERGEIKITKEYVEDLCKVLRIPQSEKQQLLFFVGIYQLQFDPWHFSKIGITVLQSQFINGIRLAKEIRQINSTCISSSLQTENYAFNILRNYGSDTTSAIEAAKRRIENQKEVLERVSKGKLNTIYIQYESILYGKVGDKNTMIDQIRSLQSSLKRKDIKLKILPQLIDISAPISPEFIIYDDILVNMEALTGMIYVTDPDSIEWFKKIFSIVESASVDGEKANQILEKAIDIYKKL